MNNSRSKTEAPGNAAVPAKVDKANITTGGKIAAFVPQDLEQAWRLSEALATQAGEMIPQAYRNQPGAVLLAISKGAELGMSPLAALQSIAAINGRATLWGDALPGLLRREGHRIEEWLEGQGEHMVAYCRVTRADGEQITRSFSVAQAKNARLWGKQGPWSQYPERMLQMRARGWACRDGAADALLGLSVREEVEDYPRDPEKARDVTPRAPAENPILATLAQAGEEVGPEEVGPDYQPLSDEETEADLRRIRKQQEEALEAEMRARNGDDGEDEDEKSPALFP